MKQHAAAKYSTELRGGRSLITCSLHGHYKIERENGNHENSSKSIEPQLNKIKLSWQ